MSKKNKPKAIKAKPTRSQAARAKETDETPKTPLNAPWISMRSGLIMVAIASLVMAVLTAWQAIPLKGLWSGIAWGLLFGGLIWVIFLGNLLLNRLLRR